MKSFFLHRDGRFWTGWALSIGVTFGLLALVVAPPFVGSTARELLYSGFSTVCHQLPARTLHIGGIALAVCHRCLGMYGGLALSALLFLVALRWDAALWRYSKWLLLGSLAVPAADWLLGASGVFPNTPASRILTGGVFGLVAGYYLARAFVQAARADKGTAADHPAPLAASTNDPTLHA